MTHYTLVMLAAGIGIPMLAAINSGLGQRIGSPVAAGMILFAVALVASSAVWLLRGGGGLGQAASTSWVWFTGGLFVAFYVLSITFIAPKIGVGNAVFFVLIGQLVSAAAIDHFGLFGARVSPLDLTRALGIAVMALGVWITQRA